MGSANKLSIVFLLSALTSGLNAGGVLAPHPAPVLPPPAIAYAQTAPYNIPPYASSITTFASSLGVPVLRAPPAALPAFSAGLPFGPYSPYTPYVGHPGPIPAAIAAPYLPAPFAAAAPAFSYPAPPLAPLPLPVGRSVHALAGAAPPAAPVLPAPLPGHVFGR